MLGLRSLLQIRSKETSLCLQAVHRERHGQNNNAQQQRVVRERTPSRYEASRRGESRGSTSTRRRGLYTSASSAKDSGERRTQQRADASAGAGAATEIKNVFFPPPPSRPSEHQPGLCDTEVWAGLSDDRRRIFCNRSLNMQAMQAIGFDMDYTLAQYKPETFESLAYRLTTEKLVKIFKYPEAVLKLEFDYQYMTRGLTVDKRRGNVLKMDRHKYVKIAYHGFEKLSREERNYHYNSTERTHTFDEPYSYMQIDTLFSLAEAYLFTQLVQMKDSSSSSSESAAAAGVLREKTYSEIYRDIRNAIDMSHRDGSLKRGVTSNPAKYIHQDKNLIPLLEDLRRTGKKLFIVTNSLWDYTNVVMNFMMGGKVGSDKNLDWLSYFDVVVVGSAKPRFFNDNQPLFQVETTSGVLLNTDEGNPMADLDDNEASEEESLEPLPVGKVFQGGTYKILNKILDIESNADILYIGDHIYGDILKSKKTLGWRTMLVVPEMEHEIEVLNQNQNKGVPKKLFNMRRKRDALEDQLQRMQWKFAEQQENDNNDNSGSSKSNGSPSSFNNESSSSSKFLPADKQNVAKEMDELREEVARLRNEHSETLAEFHQHFHPIWGQLLKTGYQNSRFANQINRFACLYTSHIGNLAYYSPNKSYRGLQDEMPHDTF
jgi:HAD superfamily 5'-nucleotidase-like hydrolase